jgi:uncharacterized protein (DUF697 family)
MLKGSAMAQKPPASVSPEQSEAIAATSSTTSDPAETTAERRDELASKLVDRFAIWSGVAGLIPVPLIDAVAVGVLQVQMLRRISQIYDVPFSDNRGKALIAALAGSMIPATSGIGAASVLKAVPIFGTIVGAFVMPVLSAGATYAIGKAFIQHFASGGTLLDFNPPDYRDFIKAHKEMWDSRSTRSGAEARSTESPSSSSSRAAGTTTGAAATGL